MIVHVISYENQPLQAVLDNPVLAKTVFDRFVNDSLRNKIGERRRTEKSKWKLSLVPVYG